MRPFARACTYFPDACRRGNVAVEESPQSPGQGIRSPQAGGARTSRRPLILFSCLAALISQTLLSFPARRTREARLTVAARNSALDGRTPSERVSRS